MFGSIHITTSLPITTSSFGLLLLQPTPPIAETPPPRLPMTLLEVITKASSTYPNYPDPDSNYQTVLNGDPIILRLKPETNELKEEYLVKRGLGRKQKCLAREASILLMVAHDEFTVSELCCIFSACVSKLNGEEMMALIKYLGKWPRKYERFPQVVPCPKASSLLGLEAPGM
ncbi:Hypothetical predicted protein [Olea europaea subsp. europaea]|uniref:Uncharacterized protein n=1 Tax=Olea europaea subsp. europaea TaxID=158383 RepID=A0A8S0SEL8_OLEEU|nr:Hypothetical predicted protein [Olea europaea subsp. europaea]